MNHELFSPNLTITARFASPPTSEASHEPPVGLRTEDWASCAPPSTYGRRSPTLPLAIRQPGECPESPRPDRRDARAAEPRLNWSGVHPAARGARARPHSRGADRSCGAIACRATSEAARALGIVGWLYPRETAFPGDA